MRQVQTDYTVAEIAQKLLRLQGEPYSLRNYPMFVQIVIIIL